MTDILLTGLDGANPLAYFAALGLLNALSDAAGTEAAPRLRWVDDGAWRPEARCNLDRKALLAVLRDDLASWRDDPALALRYKKGGEGKEAWDLKPPPAAYKAYLNRLLERAGADARRAVDFAAAFASEMVVDNNGNTKPTALHFTAGQQQFLAMVGGLVEAVKEADLEEALFGPWRYERELPVLQWDSTAARDYALRASDPSKEKKAGVPGADWLAFRGLSFFRVAPHGRRLMTTGCSGEWKTGRFRWPIWTPWLRRPTVRTLLATPVVAKAPAAERAARGIEVVFESAIRRSDQGGYGSFGPARVA